MADRNAYLKRTYGITQAMYDGLGLFQSGRCWGCRRATGASKRLAVDHDHRTGEVRMLLCMTCNRLIGHFRDDPVALVRLGLALVDPPSRLAWHRAGPLPGWSQAGTMGSDHDLESKEET